MEKDLIYSMLFDIYGELLTKTQADMLERYYNFDSSLSEIASEFGVSRQSVLDAIKKGQSKLKKYEDCLKINSRKNALTDICTKEYKSEEAKSIVKSVLDVLEEE
ncbi:MAG: hypothetical protein R3Y32_03690 [Bacillota bacterium]